MSAPANRNHRLSGLSASQTIVDDPHEPILGARLVRSLALCGTMLASPWIGQTQGPPKLK